MHIHEAVLASTSFSLSGGERFSIEKANGWERARRGRNEREGGRESHGRRDRDICSLIDGTEILESRAGCKPVFRQTCTGCCRCKREALTGLDDGRVKNHCRQFTSRHILLP